MTKSALSLNLQSDYDLMESYIMATPMSGGTQIAPVTNQSGLAEAFLIGGTESDAVSHLYQDPTSHTGWNWYFLPPNTGTGATITAIAAAVNPNAFASSPPLNPGARVVVVCFDDGSVWMNYETAAYSMQWNSWIQIQTGIDNGAGYQLPLKPFVTQVVMEIDSQYIRLALIVQTGEYKTGSGTPAETVNCYAVTNRVVFFQGTWQSSATGSTSTVQFFYSDLPLCAWLGNSSVAGCVSPTLAVFPVSVTGPVWTTNSQHSYAAFSVWRPSPPELPGNTMLISDAVSTSNTQPQQALVAGSVEDMSGSSGTPLLVTAWGWQPGQGLTGMAGSPKNPSGAAMKWVWNTDNINSGTSLWQPNAIAANFVLPCAPSGPYYTDSSNESPPQACCWFMNQGDSGTVDDGYPLSASSVNNTLNITSGTLAAGLTPINVGVIRDDLMAQVPLQVSTPVFTTANKPSHGAMTLFSYQTMSAFGNLANSNCYFIAGDSGTWKDQGGLPTSTGYFPKAPIQRLPAVLLQLSGTQPFSSGSVTVTNMACTYPQGESFSVSNWCQFVWSGGGPNPTFFAIDYDSGTTLWYIQASLNPTSHQYQCSGAWQKACQLTTGENAVAFATPSPNLGATLVAMQDVDYTVKILAVGTDSNLYLIGGTYTGNNYSDATFNDPVPIARKIAAIAPVPNPNANISNTPTTPHLFAISNDEKPILYYITLAGNEYQVTQVHLKPDPTSAPVPIYAYVVEGVLLDSNNRRVCGRKKSTGLTVQSTQPCTAIMNGVTYRLTPGAAATPITTDSAGTLHIVIPTDDITSPTLNFAFDNSNNAIYQSATFAPVVLNYKLVKNLALVSSTDLSGATVTANDQSSQAVPVFSPSLSQKDATALSQALQSLCTLAVTQQSGGNSPLPQHWHIEFDGAKITVGTGDAQHAVKKIEAAWDDFRKFLHCAASQGHSIPSVTVKTVENNVSFTCNFVLNGVSAWFNYVLAWDDPNFLNGVVSIISTIMQQAGAVLDDLLRWLSFLFDWQQIQCAEQALKAVVSACFGLLGQGASKIQSDLNNYLNSDVFTGAAGSANDLAGKISSFLDKTLPAIQSYGKVPATLSEISRVLPQTKLTFFSTLLKNNYSASQVTLPKLPPNQVAVASGIGGAASRTASDTAVTTLVTSWKASSNPASSLQQEQLASTANAALLPVAGLATELLHYAKLAVNSVLGMVAADFNTLENTFTTTNLNIPFVSQLYNLVFQQPQQQPMTVLDLICAGIAIPAVTAYEEITGGQKPFPSGTADDFTAVFTADNLLALWGLAESGWKQQVMASNSNAVAVLQNAAALLGLGGALPRADLDAILDSAAIANLSAGPPSFVLSVASIASSLALFASSACSEIATLLQNPSSNAPTDSALAAFIVSGAQFGIDTLFTCIPTTAKVLRLDGDGGICMDMALSSVSAALSALSDGTPPVPVPPVALGGDVLSLVAAIGHVGLLSGMAGAEETYGGTVVVSMLLDYMSDEYNLLEAANAAASLSQSASAQSA